ncbi:MAG TPA: hypothetical protein VKX46_13060 [Ktedonobacteraceae bacterium]|nr:hypothetical protein [Ktedonobacteraceae bacterium]
MASESQTTIDHDTIRRWAEARGGKPSSVKSTAKGGDAGILRINFPGYSGEDTLEEISWDEFFAKFDETHLAFLYQEQTSSGEESRFFKIVNRDTADIDSSSHKNHDAAHAESKSSTHKVEAKTHKKEEKVHTSGAGKSAAAPSHEEKSHKHSHK